MSPNTVLVFRPHTGGVGVELQRGDRMIFLLGLKGWDVAAELDEHGVR